MQDFKYYLKAMYKMMKQCEDSPFVKSIFDVCIEEKNIEGDEFFGDGYCLFEEIKEKLEDLENEEGEYN